jgi:hypothetical protein
MLPFRVIQIEQHRALQENAVALLPTKAALLAKLPSQRNFAATNRQIPDLVSDRDLLLASSKNERFGTQKNEGFLSKWSPTSKRHRVKNRRHRKEMINPV